jgi:hypothetical protein
MYGSKELRVVGEWRGGIVRMVEVRDDLLEGQEARYVSGAHGTWDYDPIETDERAARQREAWAARANADEQRRKDGLAWLRSLSDTEIEALRNGESEALESRGLGYRDTRDEALRRLNEIAAERRERQFVACMEVMRGVRVLYEPGYRGSFGPSQVAAKIHYDVTVYVVDRDADRSEVWGYDCRGRREVLGELELIAALVDDRDWTVIDPDDAIPREVLRRVEWRDPDRVTCLEVEGRTCYVCQNPTGRFVLDDRGHKVRKRSIVEAAIEGAPF